MNNCIKQSQNKKTCISYFEHPYQNLNLADHIEKQNKKVTLNKNSSCESKSQ